MFWIGFTVGFVVAVLLVMVVAVLAERAAFNAFWGA